MSEKKSDSNSKPEEEAGSHADHEDKSEGSPGEQEAGAFTRGSDEVFISDAKTVRVGSGKKLVYMAKLATQMSGGRHRFDRKIVSNIEKRKSIDRGAAEVYLRALDSLRFKTKQAEIIENWRKRKK